VSKSDACSSVESAQDTAEFSNKLTRPTVAYAARPLIRIMQNGSWAVGLQVSKVPNLKPLILSFDMNIYDAN
jgi:hypothetical protein